MSTFDGRVERIRSLSTPIKQFLIFKFGLSTFFCQATISYEWKMTEVSQTQAITKFNFSCGHH